MKPDLERTKITKRAPVASGRRPVPESEPISPPAPHIGPVVDDDRSARDRFVAHELSIVLSHYNVGVIRKIKEVRRGSRRSPKLRITSDRGDYLLKRRAADREDPERVAFAQDLQLKLATFGYPVAGLIPTRSSGQSVLRLDGRIYELFNFVVGSREDKSPGAAEQAGVALAQLHRLLASHQPIGSALSGSYHAAAGIDGALDRVPQMVLRAEPDVNVEELTTRCRFLRKVYHDAAARTRSAGLESWPASIIHGDWHPGNLLYRKGSIAAVLDFDSARMEPRLIDIANGALQFSMTITDPEKPESWPEQLDVDRIKALLRGYDHATDEPISDRERQTIPWLILEALIMESVLPIAVAGRFAQLSGLAFLAMVERKVRWIRPRAARLAEHMATGR